MVLVNDPENLPSHVSNKKSYYQQLTIGKEETNGIRWGTYSTIMYRLIDGHINYIPVSGLMVFQRVVTLPDLNQLSVDLSKYTQPVLLAGKMPDFTKLDMYQTILSIRYQLQNQVISLNHPQASSRLTNWKRLQNLTGKYQCYYIRLVKNRFETSHVEIMADGAATLRLREGDDDVPITGFATVDNEQVWLNFSRNERTSREKIRFALKSVPTKKAGTLLQGVFLSETLQTSQLVSGRLFMVRLADTTTPWPEFVDKNPDELVLADFDIAAGQYPQEIARSNYREWVLRFFTSPTDLGRFSDGPIWADVTRRLLEHPALAFLDMLCTHKESYDRSEFYYYVVKKDSRDENFVIERSLVTFHANGTVTLHSPGEDYTGYVYHRHDTLRLSLHNLKDGFLEIFLELNHTAANLNEFNVLYGLSAWHSPTRLQGKMAVLSRSGYLPGTFESEPKQFKFTGADKKRLETEDERTGGILSYIRGNLHRYFHTTQKSSAKLVRPRDQLYREMNFLIACYYGTLLATNDTDHTARKPEKMLDACIGHIKASYVHGYACNFAGIILPPSDNPTDLTKKAIDPQIVKELYARHMFPAMLTLAERDQLLDEEPVKEILSRISQIAGEQRYLVWAFGPEGPLNHDELRRAAHPFWPELIDRAIMRGTLFDSPSKPT